MEPGDPIDPTVHRVPDARSEPTLGRPPDSAQPTLIRGDAAEAKGPPPLPPGGRAFGRYRLEQELGRGGMGVVWKAWDPELSRHVALKQIRAQSDADAETIERFSREARLAAKLRHPHILAVHDVGEVGGERYFTSDFVDGRTLDDAIGETGATPSRQAVAWTREIADALAYAHEQGVVHRDVKPSNVILDAEGRPYIMDFGLAKEVTPGTAALTVSGAIMGTPGYMSPEQAEGGPSLVGPATDQFSLGVLFYELLTGHAPFGQAGMIETLNAVVTLDPPPPGRLVGGVHRDVDTIVMKLLEKDPRHRYPSMRAAEADLGRFLDGEPIVARPPGPAERLARALVRRPYAAAVCVAIVAASAVAGIWLWGARRERDLSAERAASAEESLRKARLVSAVTSRWAALSKTTRELEAVSFDDTLSLEDKRRAAAPLWEEVERFRRETPDDPTSRAVASAWAGWARCLAGYPDEGLAMMREARQLDPDVPHGLFMEAAAALYEYLHALPALTFHWEAAGEVSITMPDPPAEAQAARDRLQGLLSSLRTVRVWGTETADEWEAARAGLAAWERGDMASACPLLTRALGAVELAPVHPLLLATRSLVRLLQGDFDGASDDLDAFAQVHPREQWIRSQMGITLTAQARRVVARGGDPRPLLERAIEAFDEGRTMPRPTEDVVSNEGFARRVLGQWLAATGGDPTEAYERAERDITEALDVSGGRWTHLKARAMLRRDRAEWEAAQGRDAKTWIARALQDADRSVSLAPEDATAYEARAEVLLQAADIESTAGRDALPVLRRALDDAQEAARRSAERVHAVYLQGWAWTGIGDREASLSTDPTASYERAIAAFDSAIGRARHAPEAWKDRGIAWAHLGRWREAHEGDAAQAFDRAATDLEEALRLSPCDDNARLALANVWGDQAGIAERRGEDPRPLHDKAIRALDEVLAARPGDASTANSLAAALLRRGGAEQQRHGDGLPFIERAVELLDKVVAKRPDWRAARENRAAALLVAAQAREAHGDDARDAYRRAVEELTRLTQASDEGTMSRYHRALAYVGLVRGESAHGGAVADLVARAKGDLDAVLERNPRHRDALCLRAEIHVLRGDLEKAREDYRRALRLRPDDAAVQELLRKVEEKIGK